MSKEEETVSEPTHSTDGRDFDLKVVACSVFMGIVISGFVAYATMRFGAVSVLVAGVAGIGSAYYLSTKDYVTDALGSGVYVVALVMILTPFSLYIPKVLRQGDMKLMGEGVQAQNVQIGGGVLFEAASLNFESLSSGDVNSIIGLVVWSVVFFVGALIVFFVGKMIKWIGEDRKRQDRAAK